MGLLRRLGDSGNRPAPPDGGHQAAPAAPPAAGPAAGAPPPPVRPAAAPPREAAPGNRSSERTKEKDLKGRIQERLLREMDPRADLTDQTALRTQIKQLFDQIMDEEQVLLPRA